MNKLIRDLTETECAQTDGGLMSMQGVLSTLGGGLCGVPCALIDPLPGTEPVLLY